MSALCGVVRARKVVAIVFVPACIDIVDHQGSRRGLAAISRRLTFGV